jgi:hypothetical protein
MLDQGLRTAILSLRAKGHGIRQIACALQISRGAVRTVLKTGNPTVLRIDRAEKAEPYRDQILELGGSLPRQSGPRPRSARRARRRDRLPDADRLLPAPWDRPRAAGARRPPRLRARAGDAARHLAAPRLDRWRRARHPDSVAPAVLLAAALLPSLSGLHRFSCKAFLTDALE